MFTERPTVLITGVSSGIGASYADTAVMDVNEMVDAALVGFDRREAVTLPSLPDVQQWEAFNTARQAMLPNFANAHAAARYSIR